MSISTVVQETFTLGGSTADIYLDAPGNFDGYYVALKGHEEKVAVRNFGPRVILGYLSRHFDALDAPDVYFGTWLHEGYVYLDVSTRVLDKDEALRLGRENEQLAVWDIAANEEIPCS